MGEWWRGVRCSEAGEEKTRVFLPYLLLGQQSGGDRAFSVVLTPNGQFCHDSALLGYKWLLHFSSLLPGGEWLHVCLNV